MLSCRVLCQVAGSFQEQFCQVDREFFIDQNFSFDQTDAKVGKSWQMGCINADLASCLPGTGTESKKKKIAKGKGPRCTGGQPGSCTTYLPKEKVGWFMEWSDYFYTSRRDRRILFLWVIRFRSWSCGRRVCVTVLCDFLSTLLSSSPPTY